MDKDISPMCLQYILSQSSFVLSQLCSFCQLLPCRILFNVWQSEASLADGLINQDRSLEESLFTESYHAFCIFSNCAQQCGLNRFTTSEPTQIILSENCVIPPPQTNLNRAIIQRLPRTARIHPDIINRITEEFSILMTPRAMKKEKAEHSGCVEDKWFPWRIPVSPRDTY